MNAIFKSLCAIGLTSFLATSLAYGEVSTKGLAQCGGLFLLDSDSKDLSGTFCHVNDSISAGKYTVFAGLSNYRISGLWNDGWTLSLNSNRTIGSAGIQADFRHITLSAKASSQPSLASSITAHTGDSSFYASATFERGNPELASINWESENDSDEVHFIEARWETEYLRKGFAIGARIAGNDVDAHLEQIRTAPQNVHREYYIKDSSRVWFWDSRIAHRFERSRLELYYAGLYANANIFGNTYRDNSIKRFMYIPLEANLHYGDIRWEHQSFGLQARGLKADIRMEKNNKRFFETFAPNRLLPASLTQTLSFSFLQRNYRVDADLDLSAITLGGHFSPQFDITRHTKITPRIDIHGYYTYDDVSVDKASETTSFIGFKSENESWSWMLESYGLVASLGLSAERATQGLLRNVSLFATATQLIPLKTDFIERGKSEKQESSAPETPEQTSPDENKNAGLESGKIFRNGFGAHLGFSIQF